jgi:hypothetical protein
MNRRDLFGLSSFAISNIVIGLLPYSDRAAFKNLPRGIFEPRHFR